MSAVVSPPKVRRKVPLMALPSVSVATVTVEPSVSPDASRTWSCGRSASVSLNWICHWKPARPSMETSSRFTLVTMPRPTFCSASTMARTDVRPQHAAADAGMAPVYWSVPPVGRVSRASAKVPASVEPAGAVAVTHCSSRCGRASVRTSWISSTSLPKVRIVWSSFAPRYVLVVTVWTSATPGFVSHSTW